jgi:membrane-bound ClpP family serine protease
MFEWLNANIAYWHWLIFGLCLALAEIMLLSFVTLWFGLAAIVVGVLLLLKQSAHFPKIRAQLRGHLHLPYQYK